VPDNIQKKKLPTFEESLGNVRSEMPDVSNVPVQPYGFLGKAFMSGSQAFTNPLTGSVYYNPERIQQGNPNDTENMLTHELTHSRQVLGQPFSQRLMGVARSLLPAGDSYQERPNEMAAFQAERDRTLSHHLDMPDPMTMRTDITLPVSKRRAILDRNR